MASPPPAARLRTNAGTRVAQRAVTTSTFSVLSTSAFDDMLRDLDNVAASEEAAVNSDDAESVLQSGALHVRSHSKEGAGQSGPPIMSPTSTESFNSRGTAGRRLSKSFDATFSDLLKDLEAVDQRQPSVSIGAQIVKGEREKRALDQQEKERIAKETAKRQEELQMRRESEERSERERIREIEERERRAENDKKARAKLRREAELKDSDARNTVIDTRLTTGGLALSAVNHYVYGPAASEAIILPEYINALINTLSSEKDSVILPTPEDFSSYDGFTLWENAIQKPLQEVICDLLYARHVEKARTPKLPAPVEIFFKVCEARGLQSKEGKVRSPYCRIEFGQIPNPDVPPKSGVEVFMTATVEQNNSPVWNQHVDVKSENMTDAVIASVWDQRKDYFLGRVVLNVKDIILSCFANGNDGFISIWRKLEPRGGRNRDKYVGGEILIEISIDTESYPNVADLRDSDPIAYLESKFVDCKINFKTIYTTLLRACLLLDIRTNPPPNTLPHQSEPNQPSIALLSEESSAVLNIWQHRWLIRDSYRSLCYLDLVFSKYKVYEVPVWALINAYEDLRGNMKADPNWLDHYEKAQLIDIFEEMHCHYKNQVSNYQEFYAKNKTDEALESTILLLRMIFKNPVFRSIHPEFSTSFRKEINGIMVKASNERFKKILARSQPLDESKLDQVIDSLARLAELLVEDMIADFKYFKKSFELELDIVKLNADVYFNRFVGVLSTNFDTLLANVDTAADMVTNVFTLHRALRIFDEKICKIYPNVKNTLAYKGFTFETWIAPFVLKWLEHLSHLTEEWVKSAIKLDKFEFQNADAEDRHSSSIEDVFKFVNQELEHIETLNWSDELQKAKFIQQFAKTVTHSIENYCDAVSTNDVDVEDGKNQFKNFVQAMQIQKKNLLPADIEYESCVKLCNLEFALKKLDELSGLLNVENLTRTQLDHRAAAMRGNSAAMSDPHKVFGAFKLELVYAENVKPVTKSGLANPYMVIRLPEGTVIPPVVEESTPVVDLLAKITAASNTSVTLTGSLCELGRTRPINDTINPVWDESFTALLPPVSHLDVLIYSKNFVSDELCGKTVIDLSGRRSRLRQKLADHHTHDVHVEFEPQGRGLIRMTLEGEQEDVDYWFRKSRERLKRTQNDLLRALTVKIRPFIKENLVKIVREHDPVALRNGFFQQQVQYSTQTAVGVPVDQVITKSEVDAALKPILDYLDKNLSTVCTFLSSFMAREVTKRLWEDVLLDIEYVLIPPLYGQIESTRRYLNKRQVSLCASALSVLREFFHADGQGLGLPFKNLDNRKYLDIQSLMSVYFNSLPKIKREYELSITSGREKEMLVRLVRVRIEKQEEFTQMEREDGRKWVDLQLSKRRDR